MRKKMNHPKFGKLWLSWWAASVPCFLLLGTAGGQAQHFEHRELDWYVGAFGGVGTHNNIGQIFEGDVNLADSYIAGIMVGQEILRYRKVIGLDWELQAARHFNLQDHYEFNFLIVPRWHWFPWDRYLDTSFAFGNGLSYATQEPEIEIMKNDETTHLLHYFYFEFDFQLPKQEEWSFFARIHHRSGVFGLFEGIHGGSNFFTGGIKYRF